MAGWYGPHSFASAYPEPPELFIEQACQTNGDGSFRARAGRTRGFYCGFRMWTCWSFQ
ncbi:DUF6338 family protein [Nonomuraea sp. NPDC049480]|uniref:DUF6338 family protein n=1 Tax=Nonomuraea sp. NPDC049480 TaxID=3364353 RepID=UPI0037B6A14B